ncbi:MAG: hypothetical protein GY852_01785 [bacterium]|nr:hypothetical protein [bacterium]
MEDNFGYSAANAETAAKIAAVMAANMQNGSSSPAVDPKQVLLGVVSACFVMLFVLLSCVLIAYLSLAAMNSF